MTYDEARAVANRHLEAEPFPHPDYRWRLSEGRSIPEGWYFDYCFEPNHPIPEAEREQLAGAPGFIVPSDGTEVRDVAWDEYADRKLSRAALAR